MFSRTTIASSTTRPTATASPPRVMTLSVTPVSCITTSAASTDSGMLIAATSVERTLVRNSRIVMIAKSAPRPPSRTRPSRDSSMKVDRSATIVIVELARVAGGDLVELGRDLLGDDDGVAVAGLGDRERERRLAVGPGEARGADVRDLDRADVRDRDRGGLAAGSPAAGRGSRRSSPRPARRT